VEQKNGTLPFKSNWEPGISRLIDQSMGAIVGAGI